MPDEPTLDELAHIEAMLSDLDVADLDLLDPPPDVWAGIEHEIASDRTVVSLAGRRSRFLRPLLAAAAAVVVVVAGIAVVALRGSSDAVVASAQLRFDPERFDPLGADASASVSLVESSDGLRLSIDRASLPTDLTEAADLEIWLLEPDADGNVIGLVPLGFIDARDRSFAIPPGVDTGAYNIVDISVEPRDGDAGHSGRSILRGTLGDV